MGDGWADDDESVAGDFEVWAENWDVWTTFQAVAHQWRTTAHGLLMGLDMAAILPYLGLVTSDRDAQRELWQQLCHIASGVMQAQSDIMAEYQRSKGGLG